MKYADSSDSCRSCPIWQKLQDYFLSKGIAGICDDFSEKIYDDKCEKCRPGFKNRKITMRNLFLDIEKTESLIGYDATVESLRIALESAEIPDYDLDGILAVYNLLKGERL